MTKIKSNMTDNYYIAGWKTVEDWKKFRNILLKSENKSDWEIAYNDYFYERLKSRYLNPITILQDNSTYQGEGFSIVTIQCSIIEFLETTIQGLKYKFLKKGEKLDKYEYSSSKDIFISFLCKREPFSSEFNEAISNEFYTNIRCGLLHEARTKNGWKIHAKSISKNIIDFKKKIIYRDNMQEAFDKFLAIYKKNLVERKEYQQAFIRKFDSLCE